MFYLHKAFAHIFPFISSPFVLKKFRIIMNFVEYRRQISKSDSFHWIGYEYDELSKDELYYRVYHDEITNYYNWTYMWHKLDVRYRAENLQFCFVHFDIKDTKKLNIIYGHNAVNKLLCSVCDQIELEKKAGWVYEACRCDNDNFSMMIKAMPQEEIVEKLTNMFNSISVMPDNFSCRVFYRCGVVIAEDAIRKDERIADFAKYAQRVGQTFKQHDINFYTSEMYEKLIRGGEYLSRLDEALLQDEFTAWFQPKYDIHTEKNRRRRSSRKMELQARKNGSAWGIHSDL